MKNQLIPGTAPGTDPLNLPPVFYELSSPPPELKDTVIPITVRERVIARCPPGFMGLEDAAAEELWQLELKCEGKHIRDDDDSVRYLEARLRLLWEKYDKLPDPMGNYGRGTGCVRAELNPVEYAALCLDKKEAYRDLQKGVAWFAGKCVPPLLRELLELREFKKQHEHPPTEVNPNKALFDGLNALSDADEGDA